MKKILVLFIFSILYGVLPAQTAKDFSCNDCTGMPHDLFSELDSGKIVVICWVMPCSSCVPATKTTYNVVNSYASSNPGKVRMYLCDDNGDTPCSTLNKWAWENSINNISEFSNSSIKYDDYGEAAMPKVVVLGGSNHKVYDVQDNSVNFVELINAIDLSISESSAGIKNINSEIKSAGLVLNPAYSFSILNINLLHSSKLQVTIYNYAGQKVVNVFEGSLNTGENHIKINTSEMGKGLYIVRVKEEKAEHDLKLIVI